MVVMAKKFGAKSRERERERESSLSVAQPVSYVDDAATSATCAHAADRYPDNPLSRCAIHNVRAESARRHSLPR